MSLALYLGLGWVGALSAYFLYQRFGFEGIRLILWGALAYTAGALLEFARFPVVIPTVMGPHELFHILVLIGIGLHWMHVHRLANGQFTPAAGQSLQTRTVAAKPNARLGCGGRSRRTACPPDRIVDS